MKVMNFEFIELKARDEILSAYGIYKHCMYMPSMEKFEKKTDAFLLDSSVKIFVSISNGTTVGVVAVSFFEKNRVKILGIAVDEGFRNRGCASQMIKKLVFEYGLNFVLAETDDDSVGFYEKCGFDIAKFTENYGGETIVRYRCELVI